MSVPGPAPFEVVDGVVVSPDATTFAELARQFSVVPVWCELLGDLETPVSAFAKLRGEKNFLLESVVHGEQWGRFSFLGTDPLFTLSTRDGVTQAEGPCPVDVAAFDDPLAALEAVVAAHSTPDLPGLPPLHAGLVGYWGYETVRFMERVPRSNPDSLGVPEMLLFAVGTLIAFDHFRQRLLVVRNTYVGDCADDADELARRYAAAQDALGVAVAALGRPYGEVPVTPQVPSEIPEPVANMSPEAFCDMVRRAKEYILAGDIFQVVLSRRFSVPLVADPFEVHRALRLVNPSPYMTFLEHPEVTIMCASPEELVRMQGREVLTRPIAGTRWRGATDAEDAALAEGLLADEKERAEHVMLVDLARNDLGRVGEYASVRVQDFMTIVRYSHVMHLVSTVVAKARSGVSPIDVLRATFPAGTVSGAPKVRAMEIIDELEPVQRGPYAGVVGYVDFSGNLDTAITLRTAVVRDGVAHVQAGGGIVADSEPEYELNESRNKARAVLVAIAAANAQAAERAGRSQSGVPSEGRGSCGVEDV